MLKSQELNQKTESELKKMIQELRNKLRQLRFSAVSNKLKNVREIRQSKKDIARILTILKRPE